MDPPPSTPVSSDGRVAIQLDRPPEVVRLGVGRHGGSGLVERFSLPELWSLHVYSYRATLLVDGRAFELAPDDVSLVPPATRIEYRYLGPSQHFYAHLRVAPVGPVTSLPVVRSPGPDAPTLTALMRDAVRSGAEAPGPEVPVRAQADVWAVLCRLADVRGVRYSPYVAAAMAHLEEHLGEVVTVPEVARQLGLSHNHLTRLFRAELGCTVVAYLRTARLRLAEHLLRDSTMSIAAVASTVGIPDLQVFNKACRRTLGASPRAVRAGAAGSVGPGADAGRRSPLA